MKRLANHFSSTSRSHDKYPSQIQEGISLDPHHATVNKVADEFRSDFNKQTYGDQRSRLNTLLNGIRSRLEGYLRHSVWEGEVQEPSSPEEFDEIVDSIQELLVREVLDSREYIIYGGPVSEQTLHLAVEGKSTRVVKMLLDRGTKFISTGGKNTALAIAAKGGQPEMARFLLKKGAKVNKAPEGGFPPLSEAAKGGHLETVRVLLEKGADVRGKSIDWTALYEASIHGKAEVVQLLLEYGADVESLTPSGSTALQEAARMGHEEVARLLVKEGADVSPPMVLYSLAGHGLEDLSLLVVERGANVNGMAPRMSGTALHEAARTGLVELVRVLLDRGANAHMRDHEDRTPLDLALQNEHKDVAELLRSCTTSQKEKNMIEEREMRSDEPEDDPPPPYTE